VGANIYDMGVKGGWAPINAASNIYGGMAGASGTTTGTSSQGGGLLGAAGGALGGAQLYNNLTKPNNGTGSTWW
jgi:hypothetical protein